ncbi:type 1 glutamine amidotransferase domain-containing protein [Pyxidicoccus sp. MSG2]|uniref:type 1 glutamine amidotransferase domain-containing protein n=1 Tax=Pyxidicoccus sp. MSG2 TaxID=2996790 RepID=UPI002270E190|nr:type 1 glutamine amidotransferase domain-containing protein [Pyxidicoccus sp. MSG2]MCY1017117.1 type 1 glutamine amidotransferase domain-containing protein [Pyxidicoccus sp. MSG2]
MRILIVLTSHDTLGDTGRKTGFYLSELTHALDVFTRAGLEVDYVSPKGGRAPMDGVSRDDALNRAFLDDARQLARLETTLRPEQVEPARYAAIYVPGGHGTMFDLPQDARLNALIGALYARGGAVAAVCHGPAALVNAKLPDGGYLVAGRDVSAFTNEEEAAVKLTQVVPFLLESKLIERGARFTKAPDFQRHVVVSERLVTGQNPASAAAVAEALVRVLTPQRQATGTR